MNVNKGIKLSNIYPVPIKTIPSSVNINEGTNVSNYPEGESNRYLVDVRSLLPDCTASQPQKNSVYLLAVKTSNFTCWNTNSW
jgi:hypothetical protein